MNVTHFLFPEHYTVVHIEIHCIVAFIMHTDFQISVLLGDFILIHGSITTLDHNVSIYNLLLKFLQILFFYNMKSI